MSGAAVLFPDRQDREREEERETQFIKHTVQVTMTWRSNMKERRRIEKEKNVVKQAHNASPPYSSQSLIASFLSDVLRGRRFVLCQSLYLALLKGINCLSLCFLCSFFSILTPLNSMS